MRDSAGARRLVALAEGALALDQRREFHWREGKAGMATEGTGANCARESGAGMEDLAFRCDPGLATPSPWLTSAAPASSRACGFPARAR